MGITTMVISGNPATRPQLLAALTQLGCTFDINNHDPHGFQGSQVPNCDFSNFHCHTTDMDATAEDTVSEDFLTVNTALDINTVITAVTPMGWRLRNHWLADTTGTFEKIGGTPVTSGIAEEIANLKAALKAAGIRVE